MTSRGYLSPDPENIVSLKLAWKEEWSEILPGRWEQMGSAAPKKCLAEVFAAKGGLYSYEKESTSHLQDVFEFKSSLGIWMWGLLFVFLLLNCHLYQVCRDNWEGFGNGSSTISIPLGAWLRGPRARNAYPEPFLCHVESWKSCRQCLTVQ